MTARSCRSGSSGDLRGARCRPSVSLGDAGPAAGVTSDLPHLLRCPDCTVGFEHCRIHHVTFWEQLRPHRSRQPRPDLRTPPPPRPRRRLDPAVARRTTDHPATPRRHHLLRRLSPPTAYGRRRRVNATGHHQPPPPKSPRNSYSPSTPSALPPTRHDSCHHACRNDPHRVRGARRALRRRHGRPSRRAPRLRCRWAEGPVYVPAGRYCSSATSPTTASCAGTRPPAPSASSPAVRLRQRAHARRRGTADELQHGNRRVTRTEHDGTITVLADHHDGSRLNSPNDVVVHATARSGSPTRRTASTATTRAIEPRARSAAATCTGSSGDGSATIVADDFVGRTAWPSRSTRASCTSWTPATSTSAGSTCTTAARRRWTSSRRARAGGSTGSARRRGPDLGRHRKGVHCLDPDGTLIGKCGCPRSPPTSSSADRSATGSSLPRRPRSTRSG